jgi:uncharacterized repeat protein (TIGR03803 family)
MRFRSIFTAAAVCGLIIVITGPEISTAANLAPPLNFTLLHTFAGGADGQGPQLPMVLASDGNLYGSALGGQFGYGLIYRIDQAGQYSIVHQFRGGTNDAGGNCFLIQGADGFIYGASESGGSPLSGYGTVFRMDFAGNVTLLHRFRGVDGAIANSLVEVRPGLFYGTTAIDGQLPGGREPQGTIFRMTSSGAFRSLHTFDQFVDGSSPQGLLLGTDGVLYGTCFRDGPSPSGGTFWKADRAGNVTVLHVFGDPSEGGEPSPLIQASDGNFYGNNNGGGAFSNGTIFRVTSGGVVQVLHSFDDYGSDGADPLGPLIQASDGFLYGTTEAGGLPVGDGTHIAGVVYRMDFEGNMGVLHSFDFTDGWMPLAGVTEGADGLLYGSAQKGGGVSQLYGTLWRLDPHAPMDVASLTLDPNVIQGSGSFIATVTLSQPAPAGGTRVSVFSELLRLPSRITVPGGHTTATFQGNASAGAEPFILAVEASIGTTGQVAALTLLP